MNLLRSGVLAVSAALTFMTPQPVRAGDYNAEVTFRLFTASCVRRLAIADEIMAWARDVRLVPITDAEQLATFVGSAQGAKGSAWVLPSPNNRKFTLSVRAGTQTCAVWAEAGDPEAAEVLFRKMIEDAGRPGTKVETEEEQSFTTASGKSRLLSMSVADASGDGYLFTLIAGDSSGTFFSGAPIQLSMQMTRIGDSKN